MDTITRRIIHVDMDAFYASVEQADQPELKGKPVIVGGLHRGVVSASSYEARKFGVRSAMPMFQAMKLCPHGIILPVRMQRYKEVSRQVMDVLAEVSPLLEQVSIDEAYVDITGTVYPMGQPRELALEVKTKVRERTGLTCSIGIAPNKFLAKIASDLNKPDGLTIIDARDVAQFLKTLPVGKIPGVGPRTGQTLRELGIGMASDILRLPRAFWNRKFGKFGISLYEKAQGIDTSPVVPYSEPKSSSAEDTFPRDTDDIEEIRNWLLIQAEAVGRDLREHKLRGRTVTLKIKLADFNLITRNRTLPEPTNCTQTIFDTALRLLDEMGLTVKVRLSGVGVSNLCKGPQQARLFPHSSIEACERLDRAMDDIQGRFGDKIIVRGRIFGMNADEGSGESLKGTRLRQKKESQERKEE